VRRALQAFLAVGLAGFVTTILGMARAKWIALQLGPAGVATLSQLFGYSQLAAGVASLGIGAGIIREVAQARHSAGAGEVWGVVGNAVRLTALPAAVLSVAAVGWPAFVAIALTGNPADAPLIRLAGLSIAPLALVGLVQSALYGLGEYRSVSNIAIWTNLVGLAILVALVACCGTWGAVLQGALLASIQLVAFGRHLFRVVGRPLELRRGGSTVSLVGYGVLYLAIGATQQTGVLYIRRLVLMSLGVVDAGIFTAVWGISWTYLALVVGSLQPYYLTEITAKATLSPSRCMNDILKVLSAVQTPATLCAMTLAGFLLQALYTHEFTGGADLLRYLALGDLFMVASWAVFVPLLAARRFMWAFSIEASFWLFFVALTSTMLHRGLTGVFEACLLARLAQFVVALVAFRVALKIRLPLRGLLALGTAACLVGLVYASLQGRLGTRGTLIIAAIAVIWVSATVCVDDVKLIFSRIRMTYAERDHPHS
jgi:PST family polysaccharide transporter